MDSDDLTDAAPAGAVVFHAEGVLAALLDVSIEQAAMSLDLQAQFSGLTLADTAQRVLEGHHRRLNDPTRPEVDNRTLTILRQHLDQIADPLNAPTP